jgi:hypothetical protein
MTLQYNLMHLTEHLSMHAVLEIVQSVQRRWNSKLVGKLSADKSKFLTSSHEALRKSSFIARRRGITRARDIIILNAKKRINKKAQTDRKREKKE